MLDRLLSDVRGVAAGDCSVVFAFAFEASSVDVLGTCKVVRLRDGVSIISMRRKR